MSKPMSHTARPLRKPLPTRTTSAAPVYGRIGSRHSHNGGSLPIFPTQPKVGVSSYGGSFLSVRKASDPPTTTTSPRLLREKKQQEPPPRRNVQREPQQDAPAAVDHHKPPSHIRNAEPDGIRSSEFIRTTRSIETPTPTACGKPGKEVHFNTVTVHYEETTRSPFVVGLDQYERQRGPTRPPKDFQKSEAELRNIRRLRQIEDSRADEEWKAIREAESLIRADFEEPHEEEEEELVGGSEVYGDLAKKLKSAEKKGNRFSRFFRGKKRSALLVDM